jgi:fatty acid desaturase
VGFVFQGPGAVLAMPLIIVVVALCEHRLLNVIHEGAHYLIAKNRRFNDVFTNAVAGCFFLVDVDQYRITHIRHHKDLGGPEDPENAHMDKLDFSWLAAAFSGFGAISKLLKRKQFRNKLSFQKEVSHILVPLVGVLVHAILLTALFLFAPINVFIIWILATYIVAPGLGLLRNLLEHKYVEAVDANIWAQLLGVSKISENPTKNVTTRTFTTSVLSRLYGSMGFTRHLLHHWDPSISFTNLEKVHSFLLETSIGPALQRTNTTFTSTFKHLWGK